MDLAVETRGLQRKFGEFIAVDEVDLRVPSGSFYGFLGPNGAGKSTTMKCLTGLLRATRGQIRILGMEPGSQGVEIRRRLGVVPEDLALFDRLSGSETLHFVGRVHGLDRDTIESRCRELLDLLNLSEAAAQLVADYSHGMRKKLALAAALIPAPKLVFLDEPFEGIDAIASRQIKNILRSFVDHGGTVFVTSHILEIVESLCDYIGVINQGKLIAQGPLSELQSGDAGRSLETIFLELVGASRDEGAVLEWLNQ